MNKKNFKKVICVATSIMIIMINTIITLAAPATEALINNTMQTELNNNLIALFNSNGIEATVIDNQVVLKDLANVSKANDLLRQSYLQRNMAKTSYPTSYYGVYDEYYGSKKLQKASKSAVATTVSSWAVGVKIPQILAVTFVSAFFSYWFIESDTQDVYSYIAYYYSELGPGHIDEWAGNFVGDYKLKKVSRLTTNSNYTGGSTKTEYQNSTQLIPF